MAQLRDKLKRAELAAASADDASVDPLDAYMTEVGAQVTYLFVLSYKFMCEYGILGGF